MCIYDIYGIYKFIYRENNFLELAKHYTINSIPALTERKMLCLNEKKKIIIKKILANTTIIYMIDE